MWNISSYKNCYSFKMWATEFYLCFSHSLLHVYFLLSFIENLRFCFTAFLSISSLSLFWIFVCLLRSPANIFSFLTLSSPVTSLSCHFKHQWNSITAPYPLASLQSHSLTTICCPSRFLTYRHHFYPSQFTPVSFFPCLRFHWQSFANYFTPLILLSLSTHLPRKIQL